jgi:hypothetical protein
MHRNNSKLAAVALVAAIALGLPALAKTTHAKVKNLASLSTRSVKVERERVRALNGYGSIRRAPTFGAPNSKAPALSGTDFYVY